MFLKLLLISVFIILVSLFFLGIRILFKSRGRFPQFHVGHNREMRKRGITCAQDTDIGCNPSGDSDTCLTCGKIYTNPETPLQK